MSRLNLEDQSYAVLTALDDYTRTLGLDPKLVELLRARVSQINGCAYCTDMHSADALKAGVPQRQLLSLAVWQDSPTLFDARERAVLRFAESLTRLPGGVSDEVLKEMREHFSEQETGRWLMAAIAINAWNRVGVALALEPEQR